MLHDVEPCVTGFTYPNLLKVCQEIDIKLTMEQITQVERDTVTQANGTNVLKPRARRIGASQCKAAHRQKRRINLGSA